MHPKAFTVSHLVSHLSINTFLSWVMRNSYIPIPGYFKFSTIMTKTLQDEFLMMTENLVQHFIWIIYHQFTCPPGFRFKSWLNDFHHHHYFTWLVERTQWYLCIFVNHGRWMKKADEKGNTGVILQWFRCWLWWGPAIVCSWPFITSR